MKKEQYAAIRELKREYGEYFSPELVRKYYKEMDARLTKKRVITEKKFKTKPKSEPDYVSGYEDCVAIAGGSGARKGFI